MFDVAIDIDGTAEKHPALYRNMMDCWNGKVYLLTARPTTESTITLHNLEDWGLINSYDEIIMCPIPHIFDLATRTFWSDTGEIVFSSMEHRQAHFDWLRANKLTKQLDTPTFLQNLAEWKAKECLKRGIKVVFEDNEKNAEVLLQNGIYTFLVSREFKLV